MHHWRIREGAAMTPPNAWQHWRMDAAGLAIVVGLGTIIAWVAYAIN